MLIRFECPHCKARLQVGVKLIGTKGKCPNCNKEVTVPDKGADAEENKSKRVSPRNTCL